MNVIFSASSKEIYYHLRVNKIQFQGESRSKLLQSDTDALKLSLDFLTGTDKKELELLRNAISLKSTQDSNRIMSYLKWKIIQSYNSKQLEDAIFEAYMYEQSMLHFYVKIYKSSKLMTTQCCQKSQKDFRKYFSRECLCIFY